MAAIYYKRLFEVRILLEYYLQDNANQEVFAAGNPALEGLIARRLSHRQYDIRKELSIAPAPASENLFRSRYLRFIPTATGFFVGLRVSPQGNAFRPFVPMEEDVRFQFSLTSRNPLVRNITNYPFRSSLPAIYYFSNTNDDNNQSFPFLSVPVSGFQAGKTYAMGELAVIGGKQKEALRRTSSSTASHWRDLNAAGLAHEGDRILLPGQFDYQFDPLSGVNTADFSLQQTDGTVVKQLTISDAQGLERVRLDFSRNDAGEIAEGRYQLLVNGNGGFQEKRQLYLSSTRYGAGNFGLINISPGAGDFRLLEADGSLRAPAPVFEIRFKSRSAYWRYKSSQGKKLKLTPKTVPYLNAIGGGVLQSKLPRPLSFMPLEFSIAGDPTEAVLLPAPTQASFRPEPDGRVYSDIYLSPIKGLIEEDV